MANKFSERVKTIEFSPFSYVLTLVVSNDIRRSILNRAKKFSLDEPSEDMGACVYNLPNGRGLMFMPEGADMGFIVHESSHIIWFMLHHAGVALDNEIFAYFNGDLSRKVGMFVWNAPKKKKKNSDKLSQLPLDKSQTI